MAISKIRPARPEDGPAIGKLHEDAVLDWTDPQIADWWLVLEEDGDLVGAAQVVCSKPIGYLGEIVVRPDRRGRTVRGEGMLAPGGLARALFFAAEATMRANGCQGMSGVVAVTSRGWRRMLQRWGCVERQPDAVALRKDW